MLYLVLSNAFQPCSPENTNWNKSNTELSRFTKLYFDEADKEFAIKFAEWLASRPNNNGQRYYLAEVQDFVQTCEPPVKWGKDMPKKE